ncbi:aldo/keto reductase [Streptomyces sirii]|uniref:aldo/keto reductase n=1 Tax=Streptomyces sirii TaxID=3127701 RepID=UPI003D359D35
MSLQRLGIDRIDLYQLHSIDPAVPLAEQIGELVRLRQAGKIRHIGLSGQPGVTLEALARVREHTEIAAIENLYHVADRTDEPVLRRAQHDALAFICWFPLGHGSLTGSGSPLQPLARRFGSTAAQLALAWLLHRSPATIPIPGTTSTDHLEANLRTAEVHLSADDLAVITDAVDAARLPLFRPTLQAP